MAWGTQGSGGGPSTLWWALAMARRHWLSWRGRGGLLSGLELAGSRCSAGSQCHLVANVPALRGLEGPWRAA